MRGEIAGDGFVLLRFTEGSTVDPNEARSGSNKKRMLSSGAQTTAGSWTPVGSVQPLLHHKTKRIHLHHLGNWKAILGRS